MLRSTERLQVLTLIVFTEHFARCSSVKDVIMVINLCHLLEVTQRESQSYENIGTNSQHKVRLLAFVTDWLFQLVTFDIPNSPSLVSIPLALHVNTPIRTNLDVLFRRNRLFLVWNICCHCQQWLSTSTATELQDKTQQNMRSSIISRSVVHRKRFLALKFLQPSGNDLEVGFSVSKVAWKIHSN